MEIIPKQFSFNKSFNQHISYYVEDDQIRLLIIVTLVIGLILLVTGISGAFVFLFMGFALVLFMCLFKPYQETQQQP
jgi:O-antigen/teichoic acid export membrane protein